MMYTLQGLLLYWYSTAMGGEKIRLRKGDVTLIARGSVWRGPVVPHGKGRGPRWRTSPTLPA